MVQQCGKKIKHLSITIGHIRRDYGALMHYEYRNTSYSLHLILFSSWSMPFCWALQNSQINLQLCEEVATWWRRLAVMVVLVGPRSGSDGRLLHGWWTVNTESTTYHIHHPINLEPERASENAKEKLQVRRGDHQIASEERRNKVGRCSPMPALLHKFAAFLELSSVGKSLNCIVIARISRAGKSWKWGTKHLPHCHRQRPPCSSCSSSSSFISSHPSHPPLWSQVPKCLHNHYHQ